MLLYSLVPGLVANGRAVYRNAGDKFLLSYARMDGASFIGDRWKLTGNYWGNPDFHEPTRAPPWPLASIHAVCTPLFASRSTCRRHVCDQIDGRRCAPRVPTIELLPPT